MRANDAGEVEEHTRPPVASRAIRLTPPLLLHPQPEPLWLGFCFGAQALAVAAVLVTVAAHVPQASGLLVAAGLAWLGVLAWRLWRQLRAPVSRLRWDGAQWWWRRELGDPERAMTVVVALDLDGWVLLRLTPWAASQTGLSLLARPVYLPLRARMFGMARWSLLHALLALAHPQGPADTI